MIYFSLPVASFQCESSTFFFLSLNIMSNAGKQQVPLNLGCNEQKKVGSTEAHCRVNMLFGGRWMLV